MFGCTSDNSNEGPKRKKRCFPGSWSSQKINYNQWHPDDDYLLINSILHLMNISHVFYGVEFSKPYTERDIEKRWKELLSNEARSKLALDAIRNISVHDKDVLDQKIPFNEAENQKLGSIKFEEVYPNQNGNSLIPVLETFKHLLKEDRFTIFYNNRTPEQLFKAWKTQRKHINEFVKLGGDPTNFEDVDMLIRCLHDTTSVNINSNLPSSTTTLHHNETKSDYKSFQRMFNQMQSKVVSLDNPNAFSSSISSTAHASSIQKSSFSTRPLSTRSSTIEDQQLINEIAESDKDNRRRLYRKLRMIGEEARRWTCLVEAVTERPIIDRQGKNSLATLTGMKSRFLIKEKEATFGRKTSSVKPDIDLSLEGSATRISRLQGCIKLMEDQGGVFVIANWAKEPIFVDGAVVLTNEELTLRNDSMIIISGLTFRFNDNRTVMTNTQNESSRNYTAVPLIHEDIPSKTNDPVDDDNTNFCINTNTTVDDNTSSSSNNNSRVGEGYIRQYHQIHHYRQHNNIADDDNYSNISNRRNIDSTPRRKQILK